MNNYADRISKAKETLQTAQNNKIRLEEKLKAYEKRLEELKEEMANYNVTPDTIVAEIDRLDNNIQVGLNEVEEKLGRIKC